MALAVNIGDGVGDTREIEGVGNAQLAEDALGLITQRPLGLAGRSASLTGAPRR
jgi:hypothetical protein